MGWMLWFLLVCIIFALAYANPEKSKELIEKAYSNILDVLKKFKNKNDSNIIVPHTSTDWRNESWKKN